MYTVLFLYTTFILFLNQYLCETDSRPPSTLCPKGYWAAEVNDGITKDKEEHGMCQFCPQIGCYVVQRQADGGKDGFSEPATTVTADASTTHNIKRNTINTGTMPEHINRTARNKTGKRQPAQATQLKTYMSCTDWDNLPKPEDIVSYLDCVIIGKTDAYYLFIYEPRFQAQRVPVIDCVDAGFLDWIPNGTQLLGLELGFRMKHIPPYLFRYNQRIMESLVSGFSLDQKTQTGHSCFETTIFRRG
ncbi:hypothetical protein X801_07975 [Opisthorchis viverrini]|uniref:Peptidase A1 domain-containing protein n=1 Tax=Opisthorchis viverrini TaxID=6198 RepID=A0A1S8WP82_OPIVI|nr:hypothetical protein X801_07975 [Opisthorchis viverrini]